MSSDDLNSAFSHKYGLRIYFHQLKYFYMPNTETYAETNSVQFKPSIERRFLVMYTQIGPSWGGGGGGGGASEVSNLFFVCLFLAHLSMRVFRVSYCDRSVVCPFTIKKKKKSSSPKLTVRFQLNFTEMILRSWSFKYFKELNSVKNSGCHGNRMKKL